MKLDALGKLRIRAQQQDKRAAASYKEALRDAEEFWRLWNAISEDVSLKGEIKKQYLEIMNLPEDSE